jgi:hypothetical protein
MISPWGRRGKGIAFAHRPVVPAGPRPRYPLDPLATSAAVRFKRAQWCLRGSRAHRAPRVSPACCRDTGPTSAPVSFGEPLRCRKPGSYALWREGLMGSFQIAQIRIAAEKCRGEAHLVPSLGAPFSR